MESGSIRILLVEDNADDEFLLRRALAAIKTASFDLTQVGTLSEALARLRADHFDVVLLDLSLPDCKGLETVQRTLATTSKVPIVVLTGLNDEVFALKAVREGAQDYLAKGHYEQAEPDVTLHEPTFVPFSAQTRISGVDLGGRSIRKGAVDAVNGDRAHVAASQSSAD